MTVSPRYWLRRWLIPELEPSQRARAANEAWWESALNEFDADVAGQTSDRLQREPTSADHQASALAG